MRYSRWPLLVFTALLAVSLISLVETDPALGQDPDKKEEAAKEGEEATPAGHSFHGEAFNEGPRQQAVLMPGMPSIEFPTSTKDPQAQKFFIQGLGQLHGFWYFESERSFRQAAAIDPDFAMAYWGMAMANSNNQKRGEGFIAEAVSRKESVTDRERRYIDALDNYIKNSGDKKARGANYLKALEQLIYEYPEDFEARALLALSLWSNRSNGNAISSHLAIDALLQQVFQHNPMHPCHHYRIHLWDYQRPKTALTSANKCGQTSPGIAHMWHMPGHIYSRLKRYDDACWQQEASARVDHAHMMQYGVLPDQIHNFAHNNEWFIRNLVNVGRVGDGLELAKNMIELPRHPKYNTVSGRGSSKYGRARLFDVLVKYELWDELVTLSNTSYLEPTDNESEQIKRLRHLGFALAQLGQAEEAGLIAGQLEERLAGLKQSREKAGEDAQGKAQEEKKDDKAVAKAKTDARRGWDSKVRSAEQALEFIRASQQIAAGDAAKSYEHAKKAGSVDRMLLAQLQYQAGEQSQALQAAEKHVKGHPSEVQPLARQVELLWMADKRQQAEKAFKELVEISSPIDMQSPVFSRLDPIAEELGHSLPWRAEKSPRDDIGNRPDLDDLGPFRWQPSPAPDWKLADHRGKKVSLQQYRGKPVVVIFYLGYGCLHCAEQLQAFAPRMNDFQEKGISLVAISTDDREGLKASIENYETGKMPIPLASDASLEVFKAYRVHDDFEKQPLHGTFLIDGNGMILWQDISYEPFMNVDFVLTESTRLLDQRARSEFVKTSR
ncbi:MAG: redoxin domain-containing protein [Planctomycetota bacterium]|nr:redoxin domain-containing protein [Planctomycetota bacterium]